MSEARPTANPVLCLGIDPSSEVLEVWGVPDSPEGLGMFVSAIVPLVVESGCSVVKPQVAFYERHGVSGMRALAVLLQDLRTHGITVIGDAKRGDIGSTMAGYAEAWLTAGSDFEVDALTVVPYQGVGALETVLSLAAENSKGVFVLAATSNPEGWDTQGALRSDGFSVAQGVVRDLAQWVSQHPGTTPTHGIVLGATLSSADFGIHLEDHPGMPILAPGFGHQGVPLSAASSLFPPTSPVLAVVARSVLLTGPAGFSDAVRVAKSELHS